MPAAITLDGVTIAAQTDFIPSPTAGDIITSVRDIIPDPVYVNGVAQPDTDGAFLRVQSLYRWLSTGIREISRRANWMILDWTAMPTTENLPIYGVDRRWLNVDAVFANQYRCTFLDEAHVIYPSFLAAQPLWYGIHHRADQYELSLWPAPNQTDAVVSLPADITPTQTSITVSDASDFLSFGWIQIGVELIQYYSLSDNTIAVVRRGVGGTPAMVHYAGDAVTHCSVWVRGIRTPVAVTQSTDVIEVPIAFLGPLETYLLSRVRDVEQDRAEARDLMKQFDEEVKEILLDPKWQGDTVNQVAAYGSSYLENALYFGRVVVP